MKCAEMATGQELLQFRVTERIVVLVRRTEAGERPCEFFVSEDENVSVGPGFEIVYVSLDGRDSVLHSKS